MLKYIIFVKVHMCIYIHICILMANMHIRSVYTSVDDSDGFLVIVKEVRSDTVRYTIR